MKNKAIYFLCTSLISSTLLMHSSISLADNKSELNIKFRQSGYMFMRWNMGKIKKQVLENPDTYNKNQVIAASRVIDSIANSGIEKLFTPGTNEGKGWKNTLVKPEFFYNSDDITSLMKTLQENTSALVVAADNGDIDSIKIKFKSTLDACKSCHKKYRNKI